MRNYTLRQFESQFPNDDACLEWIVENRWPEGIICPTCQQVRKHHKLTNRPVYECDYCGHQVSPMAGTIFEKSSTPLRLWFYGMFLMASTRCGISAKQLQRETGVTYKTAWRMFRQIRSLLADDGSILSGEVEMDETYIGGKRRGGKRGRGTERKSVVAGIVQRRGGVIAKVVPEATAATLIPLARTRIMPRSSVYTDEFVSYNRIKLNGYFHKRIHHSKRVYVQGTTHTNSVEGFWSLVKNGFCGVYHAVGSGYLQTYLDEYAFRYNRRLDDTPMFVSFLDRVISSAKVTA